MYYLKLTKDFESIFIIVIIKRKEKKRKEKKESHTKS
jgi:hypothetical protein